MQARVGLGMNTVHGTRYMVHVPSIFTIFLTFKNSFWHNSSNVKHVGLLGYFLFVAQQLADIGFPRKSMPFFSELPIHILSMRFAENKINKFVGRWL